MSQFSKFLNWKCLLHCRPTAQIGLFDLNSQMCYKEHYYWNTFPAKIYFIYKVKHVSINPFLCQASCLVLFGQSGSVGQ